MRKIAFALTTAALVGLAGPANAQVFVGADTGWWGGPGVSIGFGPGWGWGGYGWDSYGYAPGYSSACSCGPRIRTRRIASSYAYDPGFYDSYAYAPGYYDDWGWGSGVGVGFSFGSRFDDGFRFRTRRAFAPRTVNTGFAPRTVNTGFAANASFNDGRRFSVRNQDRASVGASVNVASGNRGMMGGRSRRY